MFESETQNYYEVLDVKPDASQGEIRQAYLRSKSAYGRDSAALYSLFDEHQTRHIIETIEQAYLVLSNPEKRKEYDHVHGFLTASLEPIPAPTAQKPQPVAHVFSFASGTIAANTAGHPQSAAPAAAPAPTIAVSIPSSQLPPSAGTLQEAASIGPLPSSSGMDSPPPTATNRPSYNVFQTEDYSTPRTLASHGAAGPPVQDYSSTAMPSNENRLGIIRRIDLVKPYNTNPEMESAIKNEADFRGEFIKRVREYKGIAVDELADFTKISKAYINCIEAEEFESLPAAAYLRGFVVQIAKALKLPHEKMAAAYMANYRAAIKGRQ